jgi:hypothetical protein
MIHRGTLVIAGAILALSPSLEAGISVGYFTDFNTSDTGPAAPIAANGFTPVQITDITTFNLNTISILLIDGLQNTAPSAALLGQATALSNWVAGGGVIAFHDRNVCLHPPCMPVPGGAGITFTFLTGVNIDVETSTTLVTNGPFGIIGNTTLDGGNFSDHGFSPLATLPAGAVGILNNGTPGNEVAYSYRFGLGRVYYSTIPLDFYLDGGTPDAFRTIYAPNMILYLASFATTTSPTATAAPTLSEWGLGILAVLLMGCAAVMLSRGRAKGSPADSWPVEP